jgi:hypothetical protein
MPKFYYGELHEVGGGRPGHLPSFGGRPVDPGYGVEAGGEGPDQGLPEGPPGTPTHPIQPAPPNVPPGTVWPPIHLPDWALRPDQGLPPTAGQLPSGGAPGRPDQGLPGGGGQPDQGLPGGGGGSGAQTKKVWAFVWIRGYGHRWVVLDVSGRPLPPPGTLPEPRPPTATPKVS